MHIDLSDNPNSCVKWELKAAALCLSRLAVHPTIPPMRPALTLPSARPGTADYISWLVSVSPEGCQHRSCTTLVTHHVPASKTSSPRRSLTYVVIPRRTSLMLRWSCRLSWYQCQNIWACPAAGVQREKAVSGWRGSGGDEPAVSLLPLEKTIYSDPGTVRGETTTLGRQTKPCLPQP